ncbi:hypothetical protein K8S19_01870 [bacterium]|nr:hypothetical protein [bacterium]
MAVKQRKHIWRVVSGDLEIEIDCLAGGKIRRLLSRKSKRNFFFKDPRKQLNGKAYLEHDISGFDECFPTVGKSQGRFGMDHGVLWNTSWQASRQGDQLITRVVRPHGMPVIFTRIVSKSGPNKIHLDYTIVNTGKTAFPFIYSSHPILALDTQSRIVLPGVKQLSVLGHNGALKAGNRQPWPLAVLKNGTPTRLDTHFSARRQLAGKWFAKGIGSAEISFPSTKERLTLTWDQEKLPYMGLWLSLGIPLDKRHTESKDWICAALEPCSHNHDIINSRKIAALKPGEPYSFWMEWELDSRKKAAKRVRRKILIKKIRRMLPVRNKRNSKKKG